MRLLLFIALVTGDAPKRFQQTTYALKAAARGGPHRRRGHDGCSMRGVQRRKGPSWASLDAGAATEKILKVAPTPPWASRD